jgi:hypothetical protein
LYQVRIHSLSSKHQYSSFLQAGLFSIQSAKLEEDEPYVKTVLNRVKIKADVQKQGAILEAFKVTYSNLCPFLTHPTHSTHGVHTVSSILQILHKANSCHLERDAMGCDEYHPISKKGTNLTESGGIGYTVIDAIDTMQLMGLESEYNRARDWIANKLSFDRDENFNTFEVSFTHSSQSSFRSLSLLDNNTRSRRPSFRLPSLFRPIIPLQSHRLGRPHAPSV